MGAQRHQHATTLNRQVDGSIPSASTNPFNSLQDRKNELLAWKREIHLASLPVQEQIWLNLLDCESYVAHSCECPFVLLLGNGLLSQSASLVQFEWTTD